MVEKSYDVTVMEQLWWNRNGGRVVVKNTGGTVVVEQLWCN